MPSNSVKLLPASPVMTWYQGEDEPYIEIVKDQIDVNVQVQLDNAFTKSEFPIFLHGKQGRGKTMAAYYYARRCYPRAGSKHILWFRTPRDLQHDMIQKRGTVIAEFREAAIVVLDNFGATSSDVSDFFSDELIGLLDRRTYKPTIIISNLSPKEIKPPVLTPPLVSRLLGGTVIEYAGPDRRLNRSKASRQEGQ